MSRHFATVAVLTTALLTPVPADACKCRRVPVCQEFWEADLVFIGRATRVAALEPGSEQTEFTVKELLRGDRVTGTLSVRAEGLGGSCDRSFEQGNEYLVFAGRREGGVWRVLNCSNTDIVARVQPVDMAYVRGALTTPADGSLAGVGMLLRKTTRGPRYDRVRHARVTLRSNGREIVTHTDSRGTYRFESVPPGEYVLEVNAPKPLASIPPKRLSIGNGACAHHNFTIESR